VLLEVEKNMAREKELSEKITIFETDFPQGSQHLCAQGRLERRYQNCREGYQTCTEKGNQVDIQDSDSDDDRKMPAKISR
jgi:hypothetical protein